MTVMEDQLVQFNFLHKPVSTPHLDPTQKKLLFETYANGRRHSRLHLDKVKIFFNDKLIFADFLKKKCRLIFVVQGRNPSPGEE
jgi:hypothetical protein